jgi:flavin reductase (DIM6/NTAB) family NADH-FMN oxidoreductase RutF
VTIHSDHPFADPEGSRDAARRLRGRLSARVSLWTTGSGRTRAGLTVSSMLVAGGEPPLVVGLIDPDSDLGESLEVGDRVVVHLLEWEHRDLAEQFAGLMPAPGGTFAAATWEQTPAGPRLADASTWAACTVTDVRLLGWSREVVCTLDEVVVGPDEEPLVHRRGRYVRPSAED